MAACFSCRKELGFLTGSNPLFGRQDKAICDKCYRQIGSVINVYAHLLKYDQASDKDVRNAYEQAVQAVKSAPGITEKDSMLALIEEQQKGYRSPEEREEERRREEEARLKAEQEEEARRLEEERQRQEQQRRIAQERQEELQRIEEARRKQELKKRLEAQEEEQRRQALNPRYEYTTYFLYDSGSGSVSQEQLDDVLARHAARGWRLISVTTNELGKNSSTHGVGGFSSGTNATIDVMILIFERMIAPAQS